MKVHIFILSITSWCVTNAKPQTAITSYLPSSYTALSPHSFVSSPESTFGFSGPTAYAVSGFSSPAKYYGSPKKSYSPTKIFSVLSHKYSVPTSAYGVSNLKHFEQQFHHAPAHYEFEYKVHDHHFGSEFGHAERRHGSVAKGQYMVLLPDGRRQIVDYIADSHGYRPTIRYEGGHEKRGYRRR